MARLRHIARLMVPWWLFVEDGQKIVETFALLTDVYRQKLRSGLEARFPTRAGESAAALIGKSRLIPRGRDETLAHYAQRLKAWRYPRGHRVRGSAFALLTQVYHYWGGVACWTHDVNQNKRALDVDETPSYAYGVAWTWDGGAAAQWGRQWLVLDLSDVASAQDDFVAGGTIGIGGTTPGDWVAMRRLVDDSDQHRWMAAGTQPEWCVVSLDGSAPAPDATWEYWGVLDGSIVVPARDAEFRYVALRNDLKAYPGEADRAAAAVQADVLGFAAFDDYDSFSITYVAPSFASPLDESSQSEVVESVSVSPHRLYTATVPFEAGRPAALAVKAKQGSGDRHLILVLIGASNPSVSYDLSTGTVVAESGGASGYCSGVADADGFYTLILCCDGGAFTYFLLGLLDASYADTYSGDGSSSVILLGARPIVNLLVGRDYEFPATITMPDGSSYAGDPTSFPATITLPDDGDIPA